LFFQNKHSVTWEEIEKARKRLTRETGTVIKDWGGKFSFALIYPNSYYVGMSNLGIQVIYELLNGYPDIVCERVFWDKENADKSLLPLSVETQRPLTDFSMLGFSLSYELDYLNISSILKTSGIPLFSRERDESSPLIIAGGPAITSNPLPVAPFFDCICIGEAEAILPRFIEVFKENMDSDREALLLKLSGVPGIFVPRIKQTAVTRQYLKSLEQSFARSVVLTKDTELADMYLIEVERGCAHACHFCMVSNAFKPMRIHPLDDLTKQSEEGLKITRRIGLVGPAVTDHPQFEELLSRLINNKAHVSVSSLRVNRLTPSVLNMLSRGGLQSITIAPEAGSERMRSVINKGISEEQIFTAVSNAAASGIRHIKLYYMIGLPEETEDDVKGIVDLTLRVKNTAAAKKRRMRLSITLSPFIPKADTVFQRRPTLHISVLQERIGIIKSELSGEGIQVKHESPAWCEIQAVISRGNESLAQVFSDIEKPSIRAWKDAAAKHGIDIDFLAHTQWKPDYPLPWKSIKM
jgi:radical SAM superfamily enzyme YgiQ (UPF0313 family)